MSIISALNISGEKYDIIASSATVAESLSNTDIKVSSATNAENADKLTTSRTIAASGDISWNVSFDGTSSVTGDATINNIPSAKAWSAVSANVSSISASITDLIPDAASTSNKLADKAYVDYGVEQMAAKYLAGDAQGNPFTSKASFLAGPYYYAGVTATPTKNDYVLVNGDEDHDGAVTRYWYTGSSWSFQYVVNDTTLNEAQLAALNSTITSAKVANYDSTSGTVSINSATWNTVTGKQATLSNEQLSAISSVSGKQNAGNYVSASYMTATNSTFSGMAASAKTASYAVSAGAAPVASHQLSFHTNFSSYFSGTSALSALLSDRASRELWSSAGSTINKERPLALSNDNDTIIGGNTGYNGISFNTGITYNSSANRLKVPNISATNITASNLNLNGDLTANTINANEAIVNGDVRVNGSLYAESIQGTITSATNADKLDGLEASIFASASDVTTLKGYFSGGSAKSADKATSATTSNVARTLTATISASYSSLSAGSAKLAGTAANLYVNEQSTHDSTYYPVWANGAGNSNRMIYTTSAKLQFNPKSGQLYVSDKVKIGGCTMSWDATTSAINFIF